MSLECNAASSAASVKPRYFWNKNGFEYTLMWTVAALYFLVHGGGAISVDHLLIGREFLSGW
jgi:uncharacterized membrane protein YphA (DoxX/SURF4 family)